MKHEVFIPGLRRLLRITPSRRAVVAQVEDELRFHLESRADELQSEGLTADAASAQAAHEFGDVASARSELVDLDNRRLGRERRTAWLESVAQDVRYALRGLVQSPGFTTAVVLTLALGIGANATMFGILDRLLFRGPEGLVSPERVSTVNVRYDGAAYGGRTNFTFSYPMFADLRDRNRTFESVAAAAPYSGRWNVGSGEGAEMLTGSLVTRDYFSLVGVKPALGRFPSPDEFAPPDGSPVVVVSWGYWQRHFGGAPNVVGQRLPIEAKIYTVIGVAPRDFVGVSYTDANAWIPVAAGGELRGAGDEWATAVDDAWLQVIVRLRPGVTQEQAEGDVTRIWRTSAARPSSGATVAQGVLGSMIPGGGLRESPYSKVAKLVAAVSVLVLLIACANVANLLLSRAMRRRREIALRVALGVGRGRLIRMLLVEGLILGLGGGAGAVLIVYWAGGVLGPLLLAGTVPDSGSLISGRVLLFAAGLAVTAGVLTGLAPALQGSAPEVMEALKGGPREGGRHVSRLRSSLVATQVALAAILLVGTGLFVRSLHNLGAQRLGFDVNSVLIGNMSLQGHGFTLSETDALFTQMGDRVNRLPRLQAAVSAGLPFVRSYVVPLMAPGRDSIPRASDGGPWLFAVSPGYFEILGTRLLRGRYFSASDNLAGSPPVVIVSEPMAKTIWPGERAIGRCLVIGADTMPCSTVIGIVEDVRRHSLTPEQSFMYFIPLAQAPTSMHARSLVARVDGEMASAAERMRREMQATSTRLPYAEVRPLSTYLDRQYRPWRLGAATFTAFGVIALMLATLGTYGVLSYLVSQRVHEIGVRIALGAQTGDVLRLVFTHGVGVAVAALAVGLGAAFGLGSFIEPLLFQVKARDPAVFVCTAVVVLVSASLATLIPALRAARVDPVTSLRDE